VLSTSSWAWGGRECRVRWECCVSRTCGYMYKVANKGVSQYCTTVSGVVSWVACDSQAAVRSAYAPPWGVPEGAGVVGRPKGASGLCLVVGTVLCVCRG